MREQDTILRPEALAARSGLLPFKVRDVAPQLV
jgi:hypothetical protein